MFPANEKNIIGAKAHRRRKAFHSFFARQKALSFGREILLRAAYKKAKDQGNAANNQ